MGNVQAEQSGRAPEPYELIRALMNLQQRAIHGDKNAYIEQSEFVQRIAKGIAQSKLETWRSVDNAEAIIIFLLSGGSPIGIKFQQIENLVPEGHRTLLAGTVAYLAGNFPVARRILQMTELESVPPRLQGPLGLVLATIWTSIDDDRAMRTLDHIELMVPGTIYAETALRRKAMLIDGTGEFSKFVDLVRRYERRFPNSPYSAPFRDFVRSTVQKKLLNAKAINEKQIVTIAQVFPEPIRYRRLLQISMTAARSGKKEAASWIASYVCKNVGANVEEIAIAAEIIRLSMTVGAKYAAERACMIEIESLDPVALVKVLAEIDRQITKNIYTDATEKQTNSKAAMKDILNKEMPQTIDLIERANSTIKKSKSIENQYGSQ